jgi:SsrA-binding protein
MNLHPRDHNCVNFAATLNKSSIVTSKNQKKKAPSDATIALNKKARHDYFIEDDLVAGIVLEGWEVKSLRAGRVNLTESYVLVKNAEIWLIGCHVTPLTSASTHINTDPTRTRKLLLNKVEINKLIGAVERKGFTLVPLRMFWLRGLAKLVVGLAKGKKQHDKRATERERDWNREKQRLLKIH